MTRKIAVTSALLVFAVCVVVGMQAGNTFSGVVSKALMAMVVTLAVGLVVGAMAQKMLDENLDTERKKKLQESPQLPAAAPQRTDR